MGKPTRGHLSVLDEVVCSRPWRGPQSAHLCRTRIGRIGMRCARSGTSIEGEALSHTTDWCRGRTDYSLKSSRTGCRSGASGASSCMRFPVCGCLNPAFARAETGGAQAARAAAGHRPGRLLPDGLWRRNERGSGGCDPSRARLPPENSPQPAVPLGGQTAPGHGTR